MSWTGFMLLPILASSVFTLPLGLERSFLGGGLGVEDYGSGYGPLVSDSFLNTAIPLAYGSQVYTPYFYDNYARRYFRGRYSSNKDDLAQGLVGGLIGGLIIGKSSGGKYVGLNVDGHRIGIGTGVEIGLSVE